MEAAKYLREGIGETTAYLLDNHPCEHRRRTRMVGLFLDGRSALMFICEVRYITSHEWSMCRYFDMSRLGEIDQN